MKVNINKNVIDLLKKDCVWINVKHLSEKCASKKRKKRLRKRIKKRKCQIKKKKNIQIVLVMNKKEEDLVLWQA